MATRFVKRPGFEQALARDPDTLRALGRIGADLARAAEARGQRGAKSYRAEVVEDGDTVQVQANTAHIGAAGWLEFGATHVPAIAPMRGGAADVGLTVKDGR